MMGNRYRKWRPLVGVLAVGMLAFGLSLQGAPAGDDTAGTADRVKKQGRGMDAASVDKTRPKLEDATAQDLILPAIEKAGPPLKYVPGDSIERKPVRPVLMRVTSMTGYAASPGLSRGRDAAALTEGDPCSCDSDCAGLLSADDGLVIDDQGGCQLAQCIRAIEAMGVSHIDGTCQIMQQVAAVRCETDDDPCTVGRCNDAGDCVDPGIGGDASPCAQACAAGPDFEGNDTGQNCCKAHENCYQCKDPNVCNAKPRVTCVNDNGRANCQVDGSDVLLGRCCDPTWVLDGAYTALADCPPPLQWLEITDPDDEMHLPVRCPDYSSGIINGKPTIDDPQPPFLVVPPARQCSMVNTTDCETDRLCPNYGAYCEINADCADRCSADTGIVCATAADCIVDTVDYGPCVSDTCVDVTGPGRCQGNYAIGDDYTIKVPAGKALRLQEIRFRGGGQRQLEVIWFDFYDKSSGSPVRAGSVGMSVSQGGVYTYTIERDCAPNCDASQYCNPPGPNCECLPRTDGCEADPPFIVPADGYMVMRSGRDIVGGGDQDDLNGSWSPVVDPVANKGYNDPNVMWVDDGPIGVNDAGPLPAGQRVLAFEIVGRLINDPEGACCDPDTGDCKDTNRWECRFCSGTGINAGDVCDRGGANWNDVDRDCTEDGDECVTANWRGPRTKDEYDNPTCHGLVNPGGACSKDNEVAECGGAGLCYSGRKCADDPCSGGTCCSDQGICTDGAPEDCPGRHCWGNPKMKCTEDIDCVVGGTNFGPCEDRFQGYATSCPDSVQQCAINGRYCGPNNIKGPCDVPTEGACEWAQYGGCCPQPLDTWGECCDDVYRCTEGEFNFICDPADGAAACDNGNEGSCELACAGPYIHQITVPNLIPPGLTTIVDMTTDSNKAEFNRSDTCAYQTNDGWYMSFHVDDCALVTFNYCCTDPQLQRVSQILVTGCPCDGPVIYTPPDNGKSGYGDGCGNDYCCADGNYSVQWTARAGTHHYGTPAGTYCENSGDGCLSSINCAPGELCKDFSQKLQGHLIVEPCVWAACCNDSYPCAVNTDCPLDPHHPENQVCDTQTGLCQYHCSWLPKFECIDAGGDWLGALVPQPIADCFDLPCDSGACCLGDGSCEDANGDQLSPEDCAAFEGGDYHGGVKCVDGPCSTCEFNMVGAQIDNVHCQGDTGQYIFPSDRFQGTRRADDFRPQDSPIKRICWDFGYVTESGPECFDNPPPFDFELWIYEDSFGLPGAAIFGGPIEVDRAEPMQALRTWLFSAPLNDPAGVEVNPGECYWLEITGMGTDFCTLLWTHSVDGNNYGMRDDNMDYTFADIRDNDVTWCIDTGIVVPDNLGTNGGCGDIPVACCFRDGTCEEIGFRECSDTCGFAFPYQVCGTFECPDPPNDLCTSDPSGRGNPDLAMVVCEDDPKHPERGAWRYYTGDFGDRLGWCKDWIGEAGFGQVCNPQAPDCREPAEGNTCVPHNEDNSFPPGGAFLDAYECTFDGDNRLAATDGPIGGGDCGSENAMQADVWYKITAPCRGRAVLTLCDGDWEYDGMLSVYGDQTAGSQCPGGGDNNVDLLECNDDYCRGSGTVEGIHWPVTAEGNVYIIRQAGWSANGELCDAGQGKWQAHVGFYCDAISTAPIPPNLPPNPVHHARKHRYISIDPFSKNSNVDTTIKVEIEQMWRCAGDLRRSCVFLCQDTAKHCHGGDNDGLNCDADANVCLLNGEPAPELCYNHDGEICTKDPSVCHDETKCVAACPTVCQAEPNLHSCGTGSICPDGVCIETGPCIPHPDVGLSWFVQAPQTLGAGCPNGMCDEEDWYSRLDAAEYVSDWAECNATPGWAGGCTTLHIGDCEIVPGVKYNVYACVPGGGDCSETPLVVETTRRPDGAAHYGDVAGGVTGDLQFEPPDGFVSVKDVNAYKKTVGNWGTAVLPQCHPTWVDLHGPNDGIPPQYIIMVTDLTMIIRAWVNAWPYENPIGGFAPGDCP